jgi:glutathione synthase/RimK-type ligase-like ATP-grasp enzyme
VVRDEGVILVAGGTRDPSTEALLRALGRRAVPTRSILVGPDRAPAISWEVGRPELTFDGETVRPSAAFVRHDVFAHLEDGRAQTAQRAMAWHAAVAGWVMANESVRAFNRHASAANKPHALVIAERCGLRVPRTLVTNLDAHAREFLGDTAKVAKPVAGGGLCTKLDDALSVAGARSGVAAAPALVQEELVAPELRIYVVGSRLFAFDVASPELDYRRSQSARLSVAMVPDDVAAPLLALSRELGLNFAAADFKARPASGELVFLEINTGPMFAAFDAVAASALTDAMVDFLNA